MTALHYCNGSSASRPAPTWSRRATRTWPTSTRGLSVLDAARRLHGSRSGSLLITAGRASDDDRRRPGRAHVEVRPVPVVDTIGAGDAFAAGFVSWWVAPAWVAPSSHRDDRGRRRPGRAHGGGRRRGPRRRRSAAARRPAEPAGCARRLLGRQKAWWRTASRRAESSSGSGRWTASRSSGHSSGVSSWYSNVSAPGARVVEAAQPGLEAGHVVLRPPGPELGARRQSARRRARPSPDRDARPWWRRGTRPAPGGR